MDNSLEARIRRVLNETLIKRMLTKYFVDKGIAKEDFGSSIYPPILQDLIAMVPQLKGKIELVPSVEEMSPETGRVRLEWNLFVLGTSRMLLGESTHKNQAEVMLSNNGPLNDLATVKKASPKRLIEFISSVLGKSESGFIEPKVDTPISPAAQKSNTGQFYGGSQGFEQNRPVL